MVFTFIFIIFIVAIIAYYSNVPVTIKGHWKYFYDNAEISTVDLYTQVEQGLLDRRIEGLKFTQVSFLESHILSARRVYLQIKEQEYIFYIYCAPFGTGTFVSWWLCVTEENFWNRIPLISKLAGKDRANKSFHQMDTEAMYQSVIHSVVMEVADRMTADKGFRLSELDRQYKEISGK